MDKTTTKAVERVIATMRENLGQQLTIDDMARVAMFSKFHFSRIFQRVTGVSPGRFLSALRLQQAKQLLVSTQSNVADISLQVGYTSIGTFSSRFTRSVGLSPTAYRRLRGYAPAVQAETTMTGPEWAFGTVRGVIRPHLADEPQLTFVGLFRDRIPECKPVSCTILDQPGPFTLEKVPPGEWFLLAHSVSSDPARMVGDAAGSGNEIGVGSLGPITMRRGMVIDDAELKLKEISDLDPPVLLALLDVRKAALNQVDLRTREAAAVS
ncbi:AraC family transcriptional regulator [Catellatospora sp. TT07R-123]|uniref:helix-turn-helix domain-containing protein n=1 Tax=Catellatospora sp. TT07R-123 TaxID=2733863 RepID=UPI001B24B8B9|nr:AraC family transcriptional regulator [Catellatospora sp. TT07R-123]GHJ44248.1 AraC family transcriptional regulator [Catellatospora sp. TT07R-123]